MQDVPLLSPQQKCVDLHCVFKLISLGISSGAGPMSPCGIAVLPWRFMNKGLDQSCEVPQQQTGVEVKEPSLEFCEVGFVSPFLPFGFRLAFSRNRKTRVGGFQCKKFGFTKKETTVVWCETKMALLQEKLNLANASPSEVLHTKCRFVIALSLLASQQLILSL